VYLVHPAVLAVFNITFGRPSTDAPLMLVPFLIAVLAVSYVTHRYVEAPLQRLGRRLARRTAPVLPDTPVPEGRASPVNA
jgi:peptidoglycan/LPS O-acetylase OafA/YrhL